MDPDWVPAPPAPPGHEPSSMPGLDGFAHSTPTSHLNAPASQVKVEGTPVHSPAVSTGPPAGEDLFGSGSSTPFLPDGMTVDGGRQKRSAAYLSEGNCGNSRKQRKLSDSAPAAGPSVAQFDRQNTGAAQQQHVGIYGHTRMCPGCEKLWPMAEYQPIDGGTGERDCCRDCQVARIRNSQAAAAGLAPSSVHNRPFASKYLDQPLPTVRRGRPVPKKPRTVTTLAQNNASKPVLLAAKGTGPASTHQSAHPAPHDSHSGAEGKVSRAESHEIRRPHGLVGVSHFPMATSRRPYDYYQRADGTLIYASGALIPVGYKKPVYTKDTKLPWKCPVKLGLSQHSCDLWFGTLVELGVHFSAVHRKELLRDDGDGYFTRIGELPQNFTYFCPLVTAKAWLSADKRPAEAAPEAQPTNSEVMWQYFLPIFCRTSKKHGAELEQQGLELIDSILGDPKASALANCPKKRDMKRREGTALSLETFDQVKAFLIQVTGIPASSPCPKCQLGEGPFFDCIFEPDLRDGEEYEAVRCGNCVYFGAPCSTPNVEHSNGNNTGGRSNISGRSSLSNEQQPANHSQLDLQSSAPPRNLSSHGYSGPYALPSQSPSTPVLPEHNLKTVHNHADTTTTGLPFQGGMSTAPTPVQDAKSGGNNATSLKWRPPLLGNPALHQGSATPYPAPVRPGATPVAATSAAGLTSGHGMSSNFAKSWPENHPPSYTGAASPTTVAPAPSMIFPAPGMISPAASNPQLLSRAARPSSLGLSTTPMHAGQATALPPNPSTTSSAAGYRQPVSTVASSQGSRAPATTPAPPGASARDQTSHMRDLSAYAAEVSKKETWEQAPGRIRSIASDTPDNIAFSRSFLSGPEPVRICKEAYFGVRSIGPGQTITFDKRDDQTRLCAVGLGKLHVQLEGEPIFVLGILGLFKIRPGVACTVANENAMDAMLQITSIVVDS